MGFTAPDSSAEVLLACLASAPLGLERSAQAPSATSAAAVRSRAERLKERTSAGAMSPPHSPPMMPPTPMVPKIRLASLGFDSALVNAQNWDNRIRP